MLWKTSKFRCFMTVTDEPVSLIAPYYYHYYYCLDQIKFPLVLNVSPLLGIQTVLVSLLICPPPEDSVLNCFELF
jgi:hypothetical protein